MKLNFKQSSIITIISLIGYTAPPAKGQNPTRLGIEFEVNFTLTGRQSDPDVATDAMGNFVICWAGNGAGDSSGIYAHRFDRLGNSLAPDFLVNEITDHSQTNPSIAMTAGGAYTIAWKSYELNSNPANYYYRTRSQAYSSSGSKSASSVGYSNSLRSSGPPSISVNSNGSIFIVWQSNQGGASVPATREDIYGIRPGVSVGKINDDVDHNQNDPCVAMSKSSSTAAVVVWESFGQDGEYGGIYGRRIPAKFSESGLFRANTTTVNSQSSPSVGMDALGNYIVVWQSEEQDGAGAGIFGQRFSADGSRIGSEFPINTYRIGDQSKPSIDVSPAGEFIVVWQSESQDGSGQGVFGRRFKSSGVPRDASEFRVNTHTAGNQTLPRVAIDDGGGFVVVWQSTDQDSSGEGIYAQRFRSANLPPQVTWVRMPLSSPDTTQNLGTSVGGADPDDELVTFLYQWQSAKGASEFQKVGGPSAASATLQAADTIAGRRYRVAVTPRDASGNLGITFLSDPVLVVGDSDSDGLNDDYEIVTFGSMEAQLGSGDKDGDGASNSQEHLAGTDPLNAGSVFRVGTIQTSTSGVKLLFPTVGGRRYRVQRSGQVSPFVWKVISQDISGTGGIVEFTDGSSGQSQGVFYRVAAVPPE